MPIGYLQPLANPISRINVDYFDRKALENQARHDKARALWTEESKLLANQKFNDQAARQQFLSERDQMFENVIDSNAGNLSKGFHDVLGAVEKSALHPYHNLSKRKVEQDAFQQAYEEKYGKRLINTSKGLDQALYSEENGWLNPSDIKAGGIEATEYDVYARDILKNLKAKITSGQLDLSQSNDPHYLKSLIYGSAVLTKEDILKMSRDPLIQQVFRTMTTAGIDDRAMTPGGRTYAEMFQSDDELANFIAGANLSKMQDDRTQSYQFQTDQERAFQDRLALKKKDLTNQKALYDYQNRYIGSPRINIDLATEPLTSATFDDIQKKSKINVEAKDILTEKNDQLSLNLNNLLFGSADIPNLFDPNGNKQEPFSPYMPEDVETKTFAAYDFVTETGALDPNKISLQIRNNYRKANNQEEISDELLNTQTDLAIGYIKEVQENNIKAYDLDELIKNDKFRQNSIQHDSYVNYYNRLSESTKPFDKKYKRHLESAGINNVEDFIKTMESKGFKGDWPLASSNVGLLEKTQVDKVFEGAYLKFRDDLDEGLVTMKEIISGVDNPNPKSVESQIGTDWTNTLAKINGTSSKLALFTDENGNPISTRPDIAEFIELNPNSKITAFMNKPTFGSEGDQIVLSVQGKGTDGKVNGKPITIRATVPKNSPYFDYKAYELLAQASVGKGFQTGFREDNINFATTYIGSKYYGRNIKRAMSNLQTGEKVNTSIKGIKTNDQTILINTVKGTTKLHMTKVTDGYNNTYYKVFMPLKNKAGKVEDASLHFVDQFAAIQAAKFLGGVYHVNGRQDVNINTQYVTEGLKKIKSIYDK